MYILWTHHNWVVVFVNSFGKCNVMMLMQVYMQSLLYPLSSFISFISWCCHRVCTCEERNEKSHADFFAILCSSSMQSCVALTLKCATQTNVSRLKRMHWFLLWHLTTHYNISIRKNAIIHFYSSIVSCAANYMWEYYDPISIIISAIEPSSRKGLKCLL